jgi:N-acetylneuraminic acid mutarotase
MKYYHLFFIPLILIFSCHDEEEAEWQRLTSYPGNQVYPAAAVYNNKVYLFFGQTIDGGYSDKVWTYDVVADKWVEQKPYGDGTDQNVTRAMSATFVIDDNIYIVGGIGPRDAASPQPNLLKYNPHQDSWQTLDNFPGEFRRGGLALVKDGKAYYGLGDQAKPLKDFWVFEPQSGWTALPDFPGGLRYYGAIQHIGEPLYSKPISFIIDNEIFVISGSDYHSPEMWSYNILTKEWKQQELIFDDKKDASELWAWQGTMAFPYHGKIYVSMGMASNDASSNPSVFCYIPETRSWRSVGIFSFGQDSKSCVFALSHDDAIILGLDYIWNLKNYETWRYKPKK